MASSIASSLLRGTLRLRSSSSSFSRHRQPLFYSSSASSPLIRRALVAPNLTKNPSFLSIRFASSKVGAASSKVKADDNLKRVIESEIECAQQQDGQDEAVELPKGFPFEIIDNPGDQTIILKREFDGENIQATVFMNFDGEEDVKEDDDEDDTGDDDKEDSIQPTISLIVSIDKGTGHTLEFCCNLNSDDLDIESMAMKRQGETDEEGAYQGPEFSDLDESLQKALYKYLEVRGIKSSLFDFLHEYMMHKDDREYVTWLKNMKEFVEK